MGPVSPAPLLGLVLVGGRSARMRADKASLRYHGKPQAEHCLDLLRPHCAQAFLSCRREQEEQPGFQGLPQIHDTFLDMGPMGGILSALRAHPGSAFLVIACDLPFLDAATLRALAAARDPARIATAFIGPQMPDPRKDGPSVPEHIRNGLPEPLCAIYEPGSYPRMLESVGQGITCPRKVLIRSPAHLIAPPELRALVNANDPETYHQAIKALEALDSASTQGTASASA